MIPARRILLVEDQPDVLEMLSELLAMQGYAVVAVASAEAAWTELETAPFDLLITDLWLPGQPGTWLIEHGRKEGPLRNRPVLIVTAQPGPIDVADVTILRKPVDVERLLREIAQLLQGSPAAAS